MASHGKQAGSPSAAALEAFGTLAHPSEPNAIFAIHSKPEYKLEDNVRLAMSRAHIPRNAMAHFGAVTSCTSFPRLALDSVPTDMGGRCRPGTGDLFDANAILIGSRAASYLDSIRRKPPAPGDDEPTQSSPTPPQPMTPAATKPAASSPSPARAKAIHAREIMSAKADIAGAEEDMETAKAIIQALDDAIPE